MVLDPDSRGFCLLLPGYVDQPCEDIRQHVVGIQSDLDLRALSDESTA